MGKKKILQGWMMVFPLVLCMANFSTAQNLLPGGDFEEYPTEWKITGNGEVSLDTEMKHAGKSSLKFKLNETGSINITSPYFDVSPNSLYLVSLWYKAEGFSKENKYENASASFVIPFLDATQKGLPFRVSSGLPYQIVDWGICTTIFMAPAEASFGYFAFNLSSSNPERLPTTWIDSVQVIRYEPPTPQKDAKTFTYPAVKLAGGTDRAVNDEEAESGKAVVFKKGKDEKAWIFGPYTTEQAPGQYKALFRLKLGDNTKDKTVATIDITGNGFLNHGSTSKEIKCTDFKAKDTYQDFVLEFVKGPSGWLEFRTYWHGEEDLWIDRVKVIQEKTFTDKEMLDFWK